MSRQSTHTLQFLKEMADGEVDTAMQALAAAMKQLEQAQAQANMLAQYQQEYNQQWQHTSQRGIKADLYRNFQGFFSQLEQAVHGQNTQLTALQAQVAQKRQALQETQRKQKSYEVLIARAAQSQQRAALKRDQKLMDEFASRAKRGAG